MKHLLLLLTFSFSLLGYSQNPNTISYQGVARNATGQPIPNQAIKIRLSLLETTGGSSQYTETHTLTTSPQGLFAVQMGAGAVISGTWAGLNWSEGPKWVKTEIDPTGGDNYNLSTTSPLNAVPYALNALNGDREVTLTGQGATTITGSYPNFVISSSDSVNTYTPGTGISISPSLNISAKNDDPIWNASKLQGKPMSPTPPNPLDYLYWDGTQWQPKKDPSGTGLNGSNAATLIYTTSGF